MFHGGSEEGGRSEVAEFSFRCASSSSTRFKAAASSSVTRSRSARSDAFSERSAVFSARRSDHRERTLLLHVGVAGTPGHIHPGCQGQCRSPLDAATRLFVTLGDDQERPARPTRRLRRCHSGRAAGTEMSLWQVELRAPARYPLNGYLPHRCQRGSQHLVSVTLNLTATSLAGLAVHTNTIENCMRLIYTSCRAAA